MSTPSRGARTAFSARSGAGPRRTVGSLTVGVIGAGRVGAVLGAALARAGHR
ncbi:DUF2520 domain-containing protein, partial [Micromonospora zhanjiangensis]